MYVCTYIYSKVCAQNTHTYTFNVSFARFREKEYIHTYIHTLYTIHYTFIHTYIHTYIHTSIHPYIHTYIHERGEMEGGAGKRSTKPTRTMTMRRLTKVERISPRWFQRRRRFCPRANVRPERWKVVARKQKTKPWRNSIQRQEMATWKEEPEASPTGRPSSQYSGSIGR